MSRPLNFGVFITPFHAVGQSPTTALEYDMERTVALDRLGFDEAWFGEHHSGGYELIACPEVFIAAAAERTKHIRFGTGVVSDEEIQRAVLEVFDLRPAAIIEDLDLLRPIYALTAAYGHFGRELPEFTWERTDRVEELRKAAGVAG